MSLDRELKEAFERHASDAQPSANAWEGIEQRVVRAHRARTIAISTIALAAIAAVAIATPKILGHNAKTPFANPGASKSSEPTPGFTNMYANASYGYRIGLPDGWQQSAFEGHDEFRPAGLSSFEKGDPTFGIDVYLDSGDYRKAVSRAHGTMTIAGRDAVFEESTTSGHSIHYAIDWTGRGGCPGGAPSCSSNFSGGPKTLHVRVTGSTEALWRQYEADAKNVVANIEALGATAEATPSPASAARAAVLKFLEARAQRANVDAFLSTNAKQQYDANVNGLRLYPESTGGPNGARWESVRIFDQQQADANSWQFTVRLTIGQDIENEQIGVGPGTTADGHQSEWVVRFATRLPNTQPTAAPSK